MVESTTKAKSVPPGYRHIKPLYDEEEAENFMCDFSHLRTTDYKQVYEPSEDSFLLIDAMQMDLLFMVKKVKPTIVLEVG